nr:13889_t:CDS:2 [Entrophospora candida]
MTTNLEEALKPQSMPSGPRNILRSNDSARWSREECDVFRKALMKFGIGNWAKIIESQCLPGKTNAQMNLQLQRMLGQQSTAEFASLHIDPLVIGEKNSKIQGPDIKRKNNCIVNTGGKPTRVEIKKKIEKNKELYEISEEEWLKIELPKPEDPELELQTKREELRRLLEELANVQSQIATINQKNQVSKKEEEMPDSLSSDETTTKPAKKSRTSTNNKISKSTA